jgi:hypothetical protein
MQELDKQLLAASDIFFDISPGSSPSIFNRFLNGSSALQEKPRRSSDDKEAGSASRMAQVRKQMKPLLDCSPWLSDIQHLEDTVDPDHTWQEFEDDLALVLDISGGAATVRV